MSQLLTPPDGRILDAMEKVMTAVSRALPIPAKHQRDLPFAIRDLSRILTEERGSLSRSYWAAPRFLSAYVYYFLPWNLYRLSFLLPNLALSLLPGSRILDLGSGPLTLPLALWCARPELRSIPLHFVCSDIAEKPMEVGLAALKHADPDTLWTVSLVRGPLEKSLGLRGEPFHMVMGGNVLNELTPPKGMTLEERVGNIARLLPGRLAKDGTALLVEPGTRLGGKMISLARKGALECGFVPLAPCTHGNPCPVMEQAAFYPPSPPFNGWCHFLCEVDNAPRRLQELTRKAGFKRQSLALSFIQLQWQGRNEGGDFDASSFDLEELEALYSDAMGEDTDTGGPGARESVAQEIRWHAPVAVEPSDIPKPPLSARIISGDIRLAHVTARYACCAAGLSLVTAARHAGFGEKIRITWDMPEERDVKTGALMARRMHTMQEQKRSTGDRRNTVDPGRTAKERKPRSIKEGSGAGRSSGSRPGLEGKGKRDEGRPSDGTRQRSFDRAAGPDVAAGKPERKKRPASPSGTRTSSGKERRSSAREEEKKPLRTRGKNPEKE